MTMSLLQATEAAPEALYFSRCGFLWSTTLGKWLQRWYSSESGSLASAASPAGSERLQPVFGSPLVDARAAAGQENIDNARAVFPFCVAAANGEQKVLYAESEAARTRWVRTLQSSGRPTTLSDHFQVDFSSPLGSGMFAVVLRGKELSSGEPCAVKMVKPDAYRKYRHMLDREVAVWSAVGSHRYVLQLKEVMRSQTRVFFVSELCQGGSLLKGLAASRTYCEQDAARMMRQVLEALAHVHARGVVHCDVKPENICLATKAPDSPIKLIDFGMASFTHTPMDPGGTPEFVAPELLQLPEVYATRGCGPEVDVWSAGVLLYYLLSGKTPFFAASMDAIIAKVKAGSWAFKGPCWAEVTEQAKSLVRMMLQVTPEDRPTVLACLQHPWLAVPGVAASRTLDAAMTAFRSQAAEEEESSAQERERERRKQTRPPAAVAPAPQAPTDGAPGAGGLFGVFGGAGGEFGRSSAAQRQPQRASAAGATGQDVGMFGGFGPRRARHVSDAGSGFGSMAGMGGSPAAGSSPQLHPYHHNSLSGGPQQPLLPSRPSGPAVPAPASDLNTAAAAGRRMLSRSQTMGHRPADTAPLTTRPSAQSAAQLAGLPSSLPAPIQGITSAPRVFSESHVLGPPVGWASSQQAVGYMASSRAVDEANSISGGFGGLLDLGGRSSFVPPDDGCSSDRQTQILALQKELQALREAVAAKAASTGAAALQGQGPSQHALESHVGGKGGNSDGGSSSAVQQMLAVVETVAAQQQQHGRQALRRTSSVPELGRDGDAGTVAQAVEDRLLLLARGREGRLSVIPDEDDDRDSSEAGGHGRLHIGGQQQAHVLGGAGSSGSLGICLGGFGGFDGGEHASGPGSLWVADLPPMQHPGAEGVSPPEDRYHMGGSTGSSAHSERASRLQALQQQLAELQARVLAGKATSSRADW